jgi:hypothetical protein
MILYHIQVDWKHDALLCGDEGENRIFVCHPWAREKRFAQRKMCGTIVSNEGDVGFPIFPVAILFDSMLEMV